MVYLINLLIISSFIFFVYLYSKSLLSSTKNNVEKKLPNNKENITNEMLKLSELSNKLAYRKFNVSGVTYENRQQLLFYILENYGSGGVGQIRLVPEPDNPYDHNAIKVIFEGVGLLGYVPNEKTVDIKLSLENRVFEIRWNVFSFFDRIDGNVAYMELYLY